MPYFGTGYYIDIHLKRGQCLTGLSNTLLGRNQKDGDEILNFKQRVSCHYMPHPEGFDRKDK